MLGFYLKLWFQIQSCKFFQVGTHSARGASMIAYGMIPGLLDTVLVRCFLRVLPVLLRGCHVFYSDLIVKFKQKQFKLQKITTMREYFLSTH